MLAINAIPVVGWLRRAAICFFAAIPMFFLWNWLAPIYFYWLPPVYLSLPFWHVVGLLWLLAMLKQLFMPALQATTQVKEN